MHIQTSTAAAATATMQYPSLPASPTLTNPDMILPYGEYTATQSPPQDPYDSADLPGPWNDPLSKDMQFSIGPPHMTGPITPTTPIIYGNGTMLSDIGEVTEVESTPKRLPAPAERRALKGIGGPMRVSPAVGHSALLKRTKMGTHERKISVESTSTITSEPHVAENVFADFDDVVSVDDSVFQGDDEESVVDSVADSYTEGVIASETQRLAKTAIEEQDEDSNSSAALSKRAEAILLNAKKRLNNMEDNLSRARNSLYIAQSTSMSSIHSSSPLSRSTPSPSMRLVPQLGAVPARHREFHISQSPGGSPGHARNYSENSIPSVQSQKAPFILRSASAGAGYIGTAGYRRHASKENLNNLSRPLSASPLSKTSPPSKSSPPLSGALERLGEEEVPTFHDRDSNWSTIDLYLNPHDTPRGLGLTRSASLMQVRDLKDQMHDLKGRLSSLRDRAREDSLKRRSLQSLRTPSPFTAAEQWYTEHKAYREDNLSADKLVVQAPWKENSTEPTSDGDERAEWKSEPISEDAASEVVSVYEDVQEGHHVTTDDLDVQRTIPEEEQQEGDDDFGGNYDTAAEDEAQEAEMDNDPENNYNDDIISHEEVDDYESDTQSVYHDTIMPISHEDREDAFDYEHFFLHSAMGTINQRRLNRRDSFSSFTSEDSVETTRGPVAVTDEHGDGEERNSIGHLRNSSSTSISTIATFATASEGDAGDDDELHDDFAVQDIMIPPSFETQTPIKVKRSTFGPPADEKALDLGISSAEEDPTTPRIFDGSRQATGNHRPSVSSFESVSSTGTTRSFPLVNKRKSSPPNNKTSSILSGSDTFNDSHKSDRQGSSPVHMLAREDQILVEKLVASLGKCVLGLQETGDSSYNGRMWRRRLDAARRVLDGQEGAI